MECSLQNWSVSGDYYVVAGDLEFPRDTYSVRVEGGMLESGAKVPMQCKSRNRVTERRKRNGVGRIGGERHSVAGKIDVIVRWALKRVRDETPRWISLMIIHKSKIKNDWSTHSDQWLWCKSPFSDVKKALPGIYLPRAATRADHLGKYMGT